MPIIPVWCAVIESVEERLELRKSIRFRQVDRASKLLKMSRIKIIKQREISECM
jgi:hypothetical protein